MFHLADYSPSLREVGSQTWRRELKQRPGRNIDYWLVPCGLLNLGCCVILFCFALLFYFILFCFCLGSRSTCPQRIGPSHISQSRKCPRRLQVNMMGAFSLLGSPFPHDPSWLKVTKQTIKQNPSQYKPLTTYIDFLSVLSQ